MKDIHSFKSSEIMRSARWEQDASIYIRDHLVSDLSTAGYSLIHHAISENSADAILADFDMDEIAINSTTLKPVRQGSFRFFPNAIAQSKTAYDLAVSDMILNVCQQYLDSDFTLVNNRIVSAYESMYMPWHTDNNMMDGQRFLGKHALPGIQFVLYLTDTGQAPFQLIRNSETWSLDWPTRYLDNATVQQQFSDDLVEVCPHKGTLLALNTHLFHRGVGFRKKDFSRTLFLFQFDRISADVLGHGKRLLLNPCFINNLDPTLARVLGFGAQRNYSAFPETSLRDIPAKESMDLQARLLSIVVSNFSLVALKRLFPDRLIVLIKNMLSASP